MIPSGDAADNPETPRTVLYRAVPGFPLYRAGSDGTVWSCASGTWRPLKPHRAGRRGNRLRVDLYWGGERRRSSVPQVILLAFVGPRPYGKLCCHRDDDPANNALENLAYRTHCQNMRDAARNGKIPRGERRGNARLTAARVREVFALRRDGWAVAAIARHFAVAPNTIGRVLRRETWRHVPPTPLPDL
jgi:hypothetical protein